MKNKFLFSLIILFIWVSSAQNTSQSIDSLTQKSFKELSDLFYNSKPDTLNCIQYANAYYKKALLEKDTLRTLTGNYFLADIKNNDSLYLNFCDSLIDITKTNPTKEFPAIILYKKGRFFYLRGKYNKSLNNLTSVLHYTKRKNNDSISTLTYIILGNIKSRIGKNKEAIEFHKKAFNVSKNKNILHLPPYSTLLMNIAVQYRHLNKLDSAYYYNSKAINLYGINNDSLSLGYSYYVKGLIENKQLKYRTSINTLLKSVKIIESDENFNVLITIYTKIGQSYNELKKYLKAIKYHNIADSLATNKKIYPKSLKVSLTFLIKYYKKENNLEKQLEYINKLLDLNEYISNEKQKINKTFTEEYDIPNLLAEKKKIISELENKVQKSKRNRILYIFLLILFLVVISYQIKKKRAYKKRFLALVNQENFVSKTPKKSTKNLDVSKSKLADTIVTNILTKLSAFEKNNAFLSNTISLQTLATQFDTNANYLSKVINQYKNTSFSNYVNQLRIEYAIEKLKNDILWRKYTVKAIAQEVGFKNSESFSKAFYKFTGIKPSYFIKELEKTETN